MVPPMKLGVVDGFQTSVAAFATDIPGAHELGNALPIRPRLDPRRASRRRVRVRIDELRRAVDAYEHIAVSALEASG